MPLVVVGAIAAGAAVSVGVAVSTVAMVGVAATVVGKVTKSKELSQLGAGIGLGAGIASVATSVFGAGSAAAGTAEAGSAALDSTINSGALGGVDVSAGIADSAAGALNAGNTVGIGDAVTSGLNAGMGESISNAGGLLGSSSGNAPFLSGAADTVSKLSPMQDVAAAAQPQAPTADTGAVKPPPGTDTNSIKKWWSEQSDATKNRILSVGGSAVGSLFDGWSAEQKLALQREQAGLEKTKFDTAMKNGSAQPVVAFKQYSPQPTGLLASSKG